MATSALYIPPEWDYNPSAWSQRWPLILIALVGFQIALYLGFYQLGIVAEVWDPFFGKGSEKVLNSAVSKALPVPDAILGAFSYLLDAVTGVVGGTKRWKTKPWIVVLFGLATGPLGLTSVLLVILQPVLVGAWCTLCLVTAVISIVMISPAMDELLASLQYLKRAKREGHSWWDAFWGKTSVHTKVQ
ncbi:vitamin K epoxide reductase family protein [Chryseolinea sp. H1M3-3]|uniref:vitamin K epoxide reductase family protein n=1 Tax=Chryseolinea sp. H1M3-3 TaxID=3034144 RepID=UPI0023EAE53A|nr:vitamin K epoxide reductase family protein [Chryseolinea sp. H1M3-3]